MARGRRWGRARSGLGVLMALGPAASMLAFAQAPQPASAAPGAASPAASAAPAETAVEVRRYQVEGNTLLDAAQLDAITGRQVGRITLQRLRAAAAAVQDAYRRAGWGGVVAFLPEQDFKDGVARIRVVEGRLARYAISENKHFSAANIRASLPSLVRARPVNVRRVDSEIQLANENPSKTVQVLLEPGDQFGAVNAFVTVLDKPPTRFTARDDNGGGRAGGRWRAALGWQHANVWDRDHVFAIEGQTAPKDPQAVKVFSTSYRAPLYGPSMAVDAYYAWSNVDGGTVGTAAGDLQFSGRGTIAGLRVSSFLPRLGNVDQRLIAGLESRDYRNSCTIAGLPPGACGAAGESVSVQPASLTYTAQAAGEWRWGLSFGIHHNLALGGENASQAAFEAVRSGSRRRYTLVRANATLATSFGETGGASARLSTQGSRQPLVPGEMFGVGGAMSVRGYEERELSGDSGFALTLELSGWNWGAQLGESFAAWRGSELRPVLFADAGQVGNRAGSPCRPAQTRCRIAAVGAGLHGGWRDLQLRLDAGRALADAGPTRRGDARVHFSVLFNF
ncbi:MAG: ShlB/FhaC/HecB family hemolysin secretion/activation protein [Burkholderiales bacterium]|nr:ShlB/FhaC/HecB family hemolysin secretion/activation protein [Burkholderiales bacterium]